MNRRVLLLVAVIAFVSCGGNSPVGPTGQEVVDVAGVWNYTNTTTSVSGGECVGALLQSAVGAVDRGTLSVNQTGATLNATSRESSSGSSCTYTGTAGSSSISLGWSACDVAVITGIRCGNGALRDMRLQAMSVNATVSGRSANGTEAETWNVFVAGTFNGVGALTATSRFTATR